MFLKNRLIISQREPNVASKTLGLSLQTVGTAGIVCLHAATGSSASWEVGWWRGLFSGFILSEFPPRITSPQHTDPSMLFHSQCLSKETCEGQKTVRESAYWEIYSHRNFPPKYYTDMDNPIISGIFLPNIIIQIVNIMVCEYNNFPLSW